MLLLSGVINDDDDINALQLVNEFANRQRSKRPALNSDEICETHQQQSVSGVRLKLHWWVMIAFLCMRSPVVCVAGVFTEELRTGDKWVGGAVEIAGQAPQETVLPTYDRTLAQTRKY